MIGVLNELALAHWSDWIGEICDPRPIRWVATTNGGTFYYDNVGMFGLVSGCAKPVLVAKVCRLPAFSSTIRAEYKYLTLASAVLGSDSSVIPRPLALAQYGNDIALVTNFVDGEPLLFSSRDRTWLDPDRRYQLSLSAAQTLRFIHNRLAVPDLKAGESAANWEPTFALFRELFPLSQEETRTLDQLAVQIQACSAASPGYTLLQGDFWHGNIIVTATDPALKLVIVDWQFARWAAEASLDVYLYVLAGALNAAFHVDETIRAQNAARLLLEWKTDLIPAYLQAYGTPESYCLLPPYAGMLMCCIEMATRPMAAFNRRHPNDWMWYTLFAELRRLYPQD
jgi:hypothetical protein